MHLVKMLVAAGAIVAGGVILGGTAHADEITDGMRSATAVGPPVAMPLILELPATNAIVDGQRAVTDLPSVTTDVVATTGTDTAVAGDGLRSVTLAP
jgi:hypothetical protein